jgi:hypothetical protein
VNITRRTFKSPAATTEIPSDGLAEPTGEVSAPTAADASSPETTPGAPTGLAGESIETEGGETPPAAETTLQRAQAALASNDADIARLIAERNALLLQDALDEAGIARIDAELARHEHKRRTLGDRLVLLGAEQARLDAEAAAAAREARITEVERLLIERDAAAADLQKYLCKAEAAFRRVHELSREARNGWSWPHGRVGAIMPGSADLVRAVASYLYKVGARPSRLGGEYTVDAPPNFPGGRCPRIELLQSPEVLPDLASEYRAASKFAADIMRGITPDPVPAIPDTTGGMPPVAEQSPVMPALGITGAQSNVPVLTPEMVEIIRRQMQLAMKDDPASAAEYEANGRLLQQMSAA